MTIAEVSKRYEIPVDTLRYYERIGLLPPVNRAKSGFRDYTEGDCQWVSFIKCMRAAGIPVEALIDYVALFQQGDSTREAHLSPMEISKWGPETDLGILGRTMAKSFRRQFMLSALS